MEKLDAAKERASRRAFKPRLDTLEHDIDRRQSAKIRVCSTCARRNGRQRLGANECAHQETQIKRLDIKRLDILVSYNLR